MRSQSVSISSILFSTSSHDFAEKNVTLQLNENVSKPNVRKPLIETSNRFEPLSFLNDENQNESQYVEQKQNDETASKKVMIIGNCIYFINFVFYFFT
jgi:hypothetical protein